LKYRLVFRSATAEGSAVFSYFVFLNINSDAIIMASTAAPYLTLKVVAGLTKTNIAHTPIKSIAAIGVHIIGNSGCHCFVTRIFRFLNFRVVVFKMVLFVKTVAKTLVHYSQVQDVVTPNDFLMQHEFKLAPIPVVWHASYVIAIDLNSD